MELDLELGQLVRVPRRNTFWIMFFVHDGSSNGLRLMTLTDVLAGVGAVCGVAGAITGGIGAWYGIKAYRKTDELKALDLRIGLRKSETSLKEIIDDLVPLLDRAKTSRTRLAAAQGNYQSGASKHWLECWESDMLEAQGVVGESNALDIDCAHLSHSELEQRLITVHKLESKVKKLTLKYRDSLAEDDIGRENLRQTNQMLTEVRLRKIDP